MRLFLSAGLVTVVLLLPLSSAAQVTGDSGTPRTPWGAPDLQGIWDNRTITRWSARGSSPDRRH